MRIKRAKTEKLWLVYDWVKEKGCYLAVITDRHPRGWRSGLEDIHVLDLETCKTPRECVAWFYRALKERPWEKPQSPRLIQ